MIVDKYTPEQIDRLWKFRETLLTSFLHFVNYLLVSESILMAMVGMLASSDKEMLNIQISIISLGILITILWIYVQGKQKYLLDSVRNKCEKHMVEYSLLMETKRSSFWKISNTWLLAYFLPFLFLITWSLILLFSINK